MNRADTARVVVDTRPIGVVLLSRSARFMAFIAVGLLFWLMVSWPTPEGLTPTGQKALAIFVTSLILWVSQLLPLAITSLFAIVSLPLMGVMDKAKAYSLFGNEAVFFIMGAFILAAAMVKSGLSSRVALFFLKRFGGGSPRRLILGLLLVPAFLAFWMPEHAVAAMLFPITLEIIHSLDLRPGQSVFAKSVFLAAAYGAIIGGIATLLGGARNPLAIGILRQTTGLSIGFFEWMVAVVPTVLILLVIAYFLILYFFRGEITDVGRAASVLEARIKQLGRPSLEERLIGLIMLTAIAFWITVGSTVGLANIAISAVVALFVFKLVSWKDIEDYVNWGVILMYGGAIALGFAIESTKTAAWVAESTVLSWSLSPFLLLLIVVALSIFLTEGISNAAVVAILLPLGISAAKSFGIDPKVMTFAVAVPSGLAYMLPMGTPANAIAYSSGFIKVKDMVKIGFILNIVSIIVFLIVAKVFWPLLGLKF